MPVLLSCFYISYTFFVSNVQSPFCLTENNKKICHDNQSPDIRYRGDSNSVRYIKFTSSKGQQTKPVYNMSYTVTIFRESLVILKQILNIMTALCYYTDTDCMGDRKQMINFSIYRSWEPYDVNKALLSGVVHHMQQSNVLQLLETFQEKKNTFKI
jgi:hypothetical protein